MDEKQTIIHNVDVSKCMFFNKNYKEDDVQIKNFCELQYISCKEFDCANCYFKKWKRKEQECEEFKKQVEVFTRQLEKVNKEVITEKEKNATQRQENEKLEQVVTEIKPILELYANSKVGEEQLDGTYKITVKESKVLGDTYITFDPRPAKQALQKIREVKND